MRSLILIVPFLVFNFTSCSKKTEPIGEFSWENIQFQNSYDYLPASLIFEEAKAVVLHDIPEGVFLPGIADVVSTPDGFLVQYKGSTPLRLFDSEGKHIRQVGTIGKGPGEYSEITSFTYDSAKDRIFIHDQWLAKIVVYDSEGGVIHEITEIITAYIFHHDGFLYLFKPGNANEVGVPGFNYRLQVIEDENFQIIDKLLPIKRTSLNSQANKKVFFSKGDTVVLNPYFSNEIIKLHKGKIIEQIENISGDAFLTESERERYVQLILERKPFEAIKYFAEDLGKFPGISGFSEWGYPKKIIFSTNSGGASVQIAFNKEKLLYTSSFFDDLCSMSEVWYPLGLSGKYFIGIIPPEVSYYRYSKNEADKFKANIVNWIERMEFINLPVDFNTKFEKITNLVQKYSLENDEPPSVILLFK